MRFTVHVYTILYRRNWHYSNSFDKFSNLILFFKCHKMQYFDIRFTHRLYRVHDSLDNKDTFFIVDYERVSYKHNHFHVIDRFEVEEYIKEVNK